MIPVLIPVYKPESTFSDFVLKLNECVTSQNLDSPIVVVNDGNPKVLDCFNKITNHNIYITNHAVNLGKGRALKTGMNFILDKFEDVIGCVTCDADGQHSVEDVIKVISLLDENRDSLVLGYRKFSNDIPLRSRFGNYMTCKVFKLFTGLNLKDTQTGLRGISSDFMKHCLKISGERYEFETGMLLEAKNLQIQILETEIKTIYLNNNSSSHFNPLLDSFRIYKLLLKFTLSSCVASIFDFCLFSVLFFFSKHLFISMLIARVLSVLLNFIVNKTLVFGVKEKNKIAMFVEYSLLAVFLFLSSYFGINFLNEILKIPVYILKIIIECVLFFFSYWIQKSFIFKK